MFPSIAVIIPALNEAAGIAAAIHSAVAAGAAEVIVVDGGSSDGTKAAAASAGGRVLDAGSPRGHQLNEGAAAATSDILLFLHADTLLSPGSGDAVRNAVRSGAVFGAFSISFIEKGWRLALAAWLINLRNRLRFSPWGDQAQFIRRDAFEAAGGFREIPLMEDFDLAERMRRGRCALLPDRVQTSGRRFQSRGFIRTILINWRLIAAFKSGADPETLARIYRRA